MTDSNQNSVLGPPAHYLFISKITIAFSMNFSASQDTVQSLGSLAKLSHKTIPRSTSSRKAFSDSPASNSSTGVLITA